MKRAGTFVAVAVLALAMGTAGTCRGEGPDPQWDALLRRAARGDARAQEELATAYASEQGVPLRAVWAALTRNWDANPEVTRPLPADRGAPVVTPSPARDGRAASAVADADRNAPEPAPVATTEDAGRRAAERGSPEAQNELGVRFATGRGATEDPAAAARWFRRAARQGLPAAQVNLGMALVRGRGVPRDYAEAVQWFGAAAARGYAEAENYLGFLFANGLGVARDEAAAVGWYRKAAEQGLARAQHNLGFMYDQGLGVPRDASAAAHWYRLAAEQGLARAQHNLGCLYAQGDGVRRDPQEALRWLDRAAGQLTGPDRARALRLRDQVSRQLTARTADAGAVAVGTWPQG